MGDEPAALSPIDPVREHFAAIGVVAAEWANFEATVDYEAITLAGMLEELGACFTAQISGIGRKLDAYIAVARHLGAREVLIKEAIRFSESAHALGEKRNRIVHDPWNLNMEGNPRRFEITARKRLRYEFVDMSTCEVLKCAGDVMGIVEKFIKLCGNITSDIQASRGSS
jgi:hypothetical protein